MRIRPDTSRKIFNNPLPPKIVWEEQFDHFDNKLKKIANQNWKEIDSNDLWYYFLDLAYVELQPELFNYLFPVCLNFWYDSLMRSESTELGLYDLHDVIYRGDILTKMLTDGQRIKVLDFFHDGFIDRIEAERGFMYSGKQTPAYSWINRLNSMGYIAPIIEKIWSSWWKLDHPGKAVSAIKWASGLIYLKGENPIFSEWTPNEGGGGPYLTASDSSIKDGWLDENVIFFQNTLSFEYIQSKITMAATVLSSEPEGKIAKNIASDVKLKKDIIEIRIDDLIEGLANPDMITDFDF
ncbi:MAG: hypothetical protein R3E90_12850 [Marinicella sp.]